MDNNWITVAWRDDTKTEPSVKNLWLTNTDIISLCRASYAPIWTVSFIGIGKTMNGMLSQEVFPTWELAQEEAIRGYRAYLEKEKTHVEQLLSNIRTIQEARTENPAYYVLFEEAGNGSASDILVNRKLYSEEEMDTYIRTNAKKTFQIKERLREEWGIVRYFKAPKINSYGTGFFYFQMFTVGGLPKWAIHFQTTDLVVGSDAH